MKPRITMFIASALFLFIVPLSALSQPRADAFNLSISVEQTTLHPPQNTKVKAKIENNSGRAVNLSDLRSVFFNLTRHSKNVEECRWGDCFLAGFPVNGNHKLMNGESFEFTVDLSDLYWKDMISSQYDFREPKNMSEVIQSGYY